MIAVDGVTKRYGDLVAVDDVSFEIDRGEVVGFLGPNGAGKSTTMKILTGSLQPDEGEIRLDGNSIGEDLLGAKRRIGYLPETNALYPDMLVSEYLDFTCELREIAGTRRRSALAMAVEQTGIEAVFTRPVSQLSKGYRQRVGLAAAIVHEPEILILDEPTEGLDPNQRVGIRDLVRELGKERTVLLSTHVLGEVEATCGRLLIINRGRMVAEGTVADIVEAQKGLYVYSVELRGDGAHAAFEAFPGVTGIESEPVEDRERFQISSTAEEDLRPRIFQLAADRGWTLWELHRAHESLEQVFRTLTIEADAKDGSEDADEVAESIPFEAPISEGEEEDR